MSIGAGKYDELCTALREGADARIAIAIVIGGRQGSGFSMQYSEEGLPAEEMLKKTAVVLRRVADQIQEDAGAFAAR